MRHLGLALLAVAAAAAFANDSAAPALASNDGLAAKRPAMARRVALVVQNHTSDAPVLPLAALADTLVSRLSGSALHVVNPHNVIGVNQNRSASGEAMPEASATEIGRMLGADGVITASVQEFTGEDIGVPAVAHKLKVRLSLNLADIATGATVCGIDGVEFSRNYTAEKVKSDAATLYEGLMHNAAAKAALKLLANDGLRVWNPAKSNLIDVFFDCNVLGADIQVDGMSYGTTPAHLNLTPGVHTLLVSCPPYYFEYKRRVAFNQKGQRWDIRLLPTEKGEEYNGRVLEYARKKHELSLLKKKDVFEYEKKKRLLDSEIAEQGQRFKKQLEVLDAVIDRYVESGKVTDEVRIVTAEGIAKYNGQSYQRISIADGAIEGSNISSPSTGTDDVVEPPGWSGIEKWVTRFLGM